MDVKCVGVLDVSVLQRVVYMCIIEQLDTRAPRLVEDTSTSQEKNKDNTLPGRRRWCWEGVEEREVRTVGQW